MKKNIKCALNWLAVIVMFPCAFCCWVESFLFKNSESLFLFWGQICAMLPGKVGLFLRRAYYFLTLEKSTFDCDISFGVIFTHRCSILDKNVYIGPYALIGSCHLGDGCLIGSRASLLSGSGLHVRTEEGSWTPFIREKMVQIKIGKNVWIGEGAIVMADVGEGTLVSAGAVITSNIKPNIVVAGNPARFIRKIEAPVH